MKDITPLIATEMDENENCLSAQGKKLFCGRQMEMPFLSGESSMMTADKKALTAQSLETRAPIGRVFLSPKLIESLISAGLVRGITPMSTRKQSDQPIQVFAFNAPDGDDAA